MDRVLPGAPEARAGAAHGVRVVGVGEGRGEGEGGGAAAAAAAAVGEHEVVRRGCRPGVRRVHGVRRWLVGGGGGADGDGLR